MTIDKAIELLTTMKNICRNLFPPNEQTALSLSIEALKQVKESRFDSSTWEPRTLPGETKD